MGSFVLWAEVLEVVLFVGCRRGNITVDQGQYLGSVFLASGPDRGRSPVEWGDFLSACPLGSIRVHKGFSSPDPLARAQGI